MFHQDNLIEEIEELKNNSMLIKDTRQLLQKTKEGIINLSNIFIEINAILLDFKGYFDNEGGLYENY